VTNAEPHRPGLGEWTEPRKALRLATVKEACAYGRMGPTKLYAKIKAGTVVAYKDDKRTLIDLDSIDASLKPWSPAR
jgi:hypothetical protein